jgi:hypothetical protein
MACFFLCAESRPKNTKIDDIVKGGLVSRGSHREVEARREGDGEMNIVKVH